MSKPVIVVTGATGKTGKLVVDLLSRRQDVEVKAAVRSLARARTLLPGAALVELDYWRPDTVRSALEGASALFLVTPGGTDQIEQTWVAVEAARSAGVKRIVKLGSLDPNRGRSIQVERWGGMTERMVAASEISYTLLRPSWFNQNFTEYIFAPQVKLGLVAAPIGEGKAGWIDCRDIAAVAAAALTESGHDGKAYTLTGPELLGMREIVALLSRAAGRKIRYLDVPPAVQRWMARASGFPPRDANAMAELIGKLRDNFLTDVTDDVERVLGRPPIRFERFAEDNAAWLRR